MGREIECWGLSCVGLLKPLCREPGGAGLGSHCRPCSCRCVAHGVGHRVERFCCLLVATEIE